MKSSPRKSSSAKISVDKAFKILGLPRSASTDEINRTYKSKLEELQKKHADHLDKLVPEADELYNAYKSAFLSKEGNNEEDALPLTITGPDSLLEMFGIQDLPQHSMKVQMQQQVHYKDGQLVKKQSNRTESFLTKDGKRETKVFVDGKLVKRTIDGKDAPLN